jgi:type II secretion system protein G
LAHFYVFQRGDFGYFRDKFCGKKINETFGYRRGYDFRNTHCVDYYCNDRCGDKTETAQLQAQQIKNALQLFYIDIGRYPATGEGLRVLIEAPAGVASWQGPYLESDNALSDPWAREYIYDLSENGSNPSVMSYGRDGQKGGSGEDADITP